ncbi:MAG: SprB repeat-containing protein, partial [Chitinophagales bacterium]
MKKLTFILFLILGLSLYSQKPYPDTLTTAASAAITPPPPPPIFTLCPGLFKCHDNYICGGDFENAPDPRFYDYFVQQWSTGQNAFMDNSVDIYTGNGISPTIEQWPHSLASKWTHGPFPVSAGSCVWTPLHIMAPQGNKFLGMTGMVTDPNPALFGGLWYSEGITFKLRKELTTGKTYTLKFYSRKPRKFTQCLDFNLEVRGSTMPPCKPNVSPGKTPLWAGAASWNPACGYQYSQIFSSSMITDTVWTEFTISFTANANIEYLLLSIPQYNASCPYICSPYGYFDDFRLYDNDPLKMSSVSVVSCGNTGSIKLTPSGGTPPYFYTWLDGATTKDRINVASGTYHVRVSDAARCDLDLQIINIPSIPPIAANEAIYHPRCKGSNDGSINLFPTGGTPPYTYAWTGGLPPNQHQFGLAPGSYKVTIKDKNDCIFTSEYDIIDTLRHIDLITNTTITPYVCGGAKGSIQVRPTGGVPPYNYLWADGNRDRDRIDLLPGPYTITVMDRNHCTKTETFIVPKTGVYSNAKITLTPSYHCNLNTANIVSNVTLGVPPYTYLWSTGSTQSFTNNVSTVGNPTVFITVTESTGCINLESIILKKYIDIGTGTIYPTASSAIGAGKPFSPITKSAGRERFRINGTFHVNSSIQLNYCDVIAKPGARIYVNASSLNMDSTTIRTCVDTMWQGIEVVQGAISLKRCTIEDALYAVEVKNINSNEQFDYNTFRNNYIGISYPPRANTSVQRFTYNTFTN